MTLVPPRLPSLPIAPGDDPALPAIRRAVAERLAHVCAGMPPDEFVVLVDDIARFKRRWQLREPPAFAAAALGLRI